MKRKPETQITPADVCDLREPTVEEPEGDASAPASEEPAPPRRPEDPVAESAHLREDIVRYLAERARLETGHVRDVLATWAELVSTEEDLQKKRALILKRVDTHGRTMRRLRGQTADWQ